VWAHPLVLTVRIVLLVSDAVPMLRVGTIRALRGADQMQARSRGIERRRLLHPPVTQMKARPALRVAEHQQGRSRGIEHPLLLHPLATWTKARPANLYANHALGDRLIVQSDLVDVLGSRMIRTIAVTKLVETSKIWILTPTTATRASLTRTAR
jgi:hypothetical protein